jgi:hypothetical protein
MAPATMWSSWVGVGPVDPGLTASAEGSEELERTAGVRSLFVFVFLVFWQAEYTPCTLVPLRLLDGIRLHLDVFTKLNEPFSSGGRSCTALLSTQISICAHIGDMPSA